MAGENETPGSDQNTPPREGPAHLASKAEKKAAKRKEQIYAEAAAKRKKALDGRIAGMNWRETAEYAGYESPGAAYKAVQTELAKIPRESAKELITLELDKLNVAELAIHKDVRRGDPNAISSLLKIMDHRAKLTGAYKTQVDDNTPDVKSALLGLLAGAVAINNGDVEGLERATDAIDSGTAVEDAPLGEQEEPGAAA